MGPISSVIVLLVIALAVLLALWRRATRDADYQRGLKDVAHAQRELLSQELQRSTAQRFAERREGLVLVGPHDSEVARDVFAVVRAAATYSDVEPPLAKLRKTLLAGAVPEPLAFLVPGSAKRTGDLQ